MRHARDACPDGAWCEGTGAAGTTRPLTAWLPLFSEQHRPSTAQASRCLLEGTCLSSGPLNTKLWGSLEPPGSPALLVPLQSQLRSQGGRATLRQALAPATPCVLTLNVKLLGLGFIRGDLKGGTGLSWPLWPRLQWPCLETQGATRCVFSK